MPTIVIVDDQSTGRRLLAELMRKIDSDVRVVDFGDAESARAWAEGEVGSAKHAWREVLRGRFLVFPSVGAEWF